MIKAVIFDMDGVISDSETPNFKAMLRTLKPFDISFDFNYYSQFPGHSCIESYSIIRRDFNADFDVADMVRQFNEMRLVIAKEDGWPAVKNAIDMVRYCSSKYAVALASGSAQEVIDDVLNAFDITDCFESKLSGEKIENCKPAPDIFLITAENLGVKPHECAVIEDSNNGVQAAKAANMMCIGYVNPLSGKQDLSMSDYIIDDMAKIKDIL